VLLPQAINNLAELYRAKTVIESRRAQGQESDCLHFAASETGDRVNGRRVWMACLLVVECEELVPVVAAVNIAPKCCIRRLAGKDAGSVPEMRTRWGVVCHRKAVEKMGASNRLLIKDVELGITFDAVVTQTKKRAFFLVLSPEPKDVLSMSPPLKLADQSWKDAMKKTRTLLYMIQASARCGRGFDDLGLPGDLSELEPEVPAFCFQGIVSALQSTANPPIAN
jgi:hypothetical protein